MVAEANKYLQEQDDLIARLALEMEEGNFSRRSALLAETSFFVRQIRGICDAEIAKVEEWIAKGEYIIKELEALYMLKKYRTLKRRYYKEET